MRACVPVFLVSPDRSFLPVLHYADLWKLFLEASALSTRTFVDTRTRETSPCNLRQSRIVLADAKFAQKLRRTSPFAHTAFAQRQDDRANV